MLDTSTKKRIDDCRDILVGKLPDPKAQIEQITIGLIYKFMDDMDKDAIELGSTAKFFSGNFEKYSWDNLFDTKVTATEMLSLYLKAIESMDKNPSIPQLFRNIFNNAYLPYRDPETLKLFLKTIGKFEYTHSEKLGDAFEYLLSVMGSQGDAGQFRTPRHIIDFMVAIVDPDKKDSILDPACGTAGFLISAFKYIKEKNKKGLTPDQRKKLIQSFEGYDISPDMVRLSLVNLYLHGFSDPHIHEYDTLSSEERWDKSYDVILANPPFMSPKGGIRPHKRFTISSNRSEVLFVDYIVEHLNPKGKAGVIVPEGVIFQSGTAYKDLRRMLVENCLYAVVSLPAGVFNPYSGVKTSILLMDKEVAKQRNEILFVKIDNDGFNLGAQRTAVKGSQFKEAIEVIHDFVKTGEFKEQNIAHSVPKTEIARNGDYNLSGERYISIEALNSDYELVPLSELTELITKGTTPTSIGHSFEEGGINFIKIESITEHGTFIKEKFNYISQECNNDLKRSQLQENDVLFSIAGAFGRSAVVLREILPANTNQALSIIRPSERLLPKYLRAVLKSEQVLRLIETLKVGVAQYNLSLKQIKEIQIPLPPLTIQEEIIAEIEGFQKIIDGAKAVVDNYKPKIDIDSEWEKVELGELGKLIGGGTPSRQIKEYWENGDIDWVSCSDFTSNSVCLPDSSRKITQAGLENSSSNLIDAGSLVLVTRVSLGKLAFTSKPTAINQDLTALYFTSDSINKYFAYYYLLSIANKIVQDGNGITVKGVNRDYVKRIKIPIPPLEIQQQIVAQIEEEQGLVNANKKLIDIFEQKMNGRIAKVWGE